MRKINCATVYAAMGAVLTAALVVGVAASGPSSAEGRGDTVKRLDRSVITAAEIDATVTRLMKAAEVPGTAIVIINGGKVVFAKGYGLRDKEKNIPLMENPVMRGAVF